MYVCGRETGTKISCRCSSVFVVDIGVLQNDDCCSGVVILVCECPFDDIQCEIADGAEVWKTNIARRGFVVYRLWKAEITLFVLL